MNNQLFHIMNHWVLEKNVKNLKAQVYFDDNSGVNLFLPAKSIFASPVFTVEKTGFFHFRAKTCQPCSQSNNRTRMCLNKGEKASYSMYAFYAWLLARDLTAGMG